MLTIRRKQMEAFEADAARRFHEALCQQVRREFPEPTSNLTDAELYKLVALGVQRGRKYGLVSARDLTLFVDLMFAHSPNFEDAPQMTWAKKILFRSDLEGEVKMSLIYQRLAAQQAKAAELSWDS